MFFVPYDPAGVTIFNPFVQAVTLYSCDTVSGGTSSFVCCLADTLQCFVAENVSRPLCFCRG